MSYQDIADGRSRELRSYNQKPTDEATSMLIQGVFKMQTELTRLKTDVRQLGTARDTVVLRQRIAAGNARLKAAALEIGEQLKSLAVQNKSLQMQKIIGNFQGVLSEFESTMKLAHSKEASCLPMVPAQIPADVETGLAGQGAEEAALLQQAKQQEFIRVDEELQYNEVLIEERDEAIQQISQQIGEVHEIFQDLATLVNDQAGMVDDISDHIGRTAVRTQQGQEQLVRAERSQRGARNRQCIILVIAASALAVLFLVIIS